VRRAAPWVAHVVQTVEHGDEVETLFGNGFRRSGLETNPVRDAVRLCVCVRCSIDGAWKS